MTDWPIADPVWLKPADRALHAEMLARQAHEHQPMSFYDSVRVMRLCALGVAQMVAPFGAQRRYEAIAVPWMDAVKMGYVRDGLVHWEYA